MLQLSRRSSRHRLFLRQTFLNIGLEARIDGLLTRVAAVESLANNMTAAVAIQGSQTSKQLAALQSSNATLYVSVTALQSSPSVDYHTVGGSNSLGVVFQGSWSAITPVGFAQSRG
jgi:hypothetical protein